MNEEVALEKFVWNMLEQEYGGLRDAVDYQLRHEQLIAVIEVLATAHTQFVDNPSFVNWNIMITAMSTYQYWKQKEVK
jgi:hypothetical protein|tara:strand:+ start:2251 stop:2484 length:234 start_codon:yes stop_codon:yes gene_type:complete